MQVPISQAVRVQEKNRESRSQKAAVKSTTTERSKSVQSDQKKSGVCAIV